jgi:hypothetical protein
MLTAYILDDPDRPNVCRQKWQEPLYGNPLAKVGVKIFDMALYPETNSDPKEEEALDQERKESSGQGNEVSVRLENRSWFALLYVGRMYGPNQWCQNLKQWPKKEGDLERKGLVVWYQDLVPL